LSFISEAKAFSKAQASAFIGGVVDYVVMLLCVEVFSSHYVTGIIVGGIVGAFVNYAINRYWSFRGSHESARQQIGKFVVVVVGSILLKSAGTSLLTEWMSIDYRISRLITDGLVSLVFNYTLQRWWVFKKQLSHP